MRTKTRAMAAHRMVNLVAADQVEHILWDGNKISGVIQQIKRGLTAENIIKMVGERVYRRAFNLSNAIESKNAFLIHRTAMEMGFVFPVGQTLELTPRGEAELMLIATRDFESNKGIVEAGGTQLKSFEPVARRMFLQNQPMWVAKYKHKLKNPDEGNLILTAYMRGLKISPDAAVAAVEEHLLGRLKARHYETIEEDMVDTLKRIAEFYPVKDATSEAALQMFNMLQRQLDSVDTVEEIEDNSVDAPASDEDDLTDEKVERSMSESIGPYMVTGDPRGRLVAHILELQLLRKAIKSGEYQPMVFAEKQGLVTKLTTDNLYEDNIRPIVDFYTGKELLGNDMLYVNVTLTDDEKNDEREDFPYDANIDRKGIKRYVKEAKYVDFVKTTVEHSYTSISTPRSTDAFGAEFFAPKLGVMQHTIKRQAGERKVVQVIQRFNDWNGFLNTDDEFNQEVESDFQLNKLYEKAEFWKEWRKNAILAGISTPQGKDHINVVGYEQYCIDMLELLIMSKYTKAVEQYDCQMDSIKAKKETNPAYKVKYLAVPDLKSIGNKIMYWYNWDNMCPTYTNRYEEQLMIEA